MNIYMRQRVNTLTDESALALTQNNISLSANGLYISEPHLLQVANYSPECGVELFPIRSWLKACYPDHFNNKTYPPLGDMSISDIEDIIRIGVIKVRDTLNSYNLTPRFIYVLTENEWNYTSNEEEKQKLVELYARIETAVACVWPLATQIWYIYGWHHTFPGRNPAWPESLKAVFIQESQTLYRLPQAWETISQIANGSQFDRWTAFIGLHCWRDEDGIWHSGDSGIIDTEIYNSIAKLFLMLKNPPENIFFYHETAPVENCIDTLLSFSKSLNNS
jgi:hypothetical protein